VDGNSEGASVGLNAYLAAMSKPYFQHQQPNNIDININLTGHRKLLTFPASIAFLQESISISSSASTQASSGTSLLLSTSESSSLALSNKLAAQLRASNELSNSATVASLCQHGLHIELRKHMSKVKIVAMIRYIIVIIIVIMHKLFSTLLC
jgi:hypothetical protein